MHTPEYQEAEIRVQHWAATAGRAVSTDEFENKFHQFHDKEKKKTHMKTWAALLREKLKADADVKKQVQKKMKSPPPATQTSGEAMDTDTISVMPVAMISPPSSSAHREIPEKKTTKRTMEKIIDPDSG